MKKIKITSTHIEKFLKYYDSYNILDYPLMIKTVDLVAYVSKSGNANYAKHLGLVLKYMNIENVDRSPLKHDISDIFKAFKGLDIDYNDLLIDFLCNVINTNQIKYKTFIELSLRINAISYFSEDIFELFKPQILESIELVTQTLNIEYEFCGYESLFNKCYFNEKFNDNYISNLMTIIGNCE